MHRLDKAGQAVKKASEDLTKAAKDAREAKDEAQVNLLFLTHRDKDFFSLLGCQRATTICLGN